MSPLAERMGPRLRRLRRQALLRQPRAFEDCGGASLRAGDRTLINFSGNDYLGLARDRRLAEALAAAAERYGCGAGASLLVSGTRPVHRELEHATAAFLGRERALLFASGYAANLAVAQAFCGRGDTIVQDRLAHASLIDGARLSGARLRRYPHGAVAQCRQQLRQGSGEILLVTDGVFSMDGDKADLPGLAAAATEYGATLVVDDAHGIGVLGATGRGLLEEQDCANETVPVLVGTYGKAFGVAGAFVAGEKPVIDYLEQVARSRTYSTAPPPAQAAAALRALQIVDTEPALRQRLRQNLECFRRRAAAAGLELSASQTPIQPVILGSAERALAASDALLRHGYWVSAIRPPTVPAGRARLRVTLSAAHDSAQVAGLVEAVGACVHTAAAAT